MPLSPKDRRALIVFGVVVVAALAAYFLLLRGDGEEPGPVAQATQGPTTQPTTSPTPTPRKTPSPGVVLGGRDPFSPLISPGGGGGPAGGGTFTPPPSNPFTPPPTSPGGGTTPPPTSPGGTASPTPTFTFTSPGPTSPSPTESGAGTQMGGHSVVLVDIFTAPDGTPTAQVEVDGQVYTVSEGEEFAANFRLIDISGQCATFLFGDEQFALCENPQK